MGDASLPRFKLSLLGRFALAGPGGFVDLPNKKLAGLLAYLASTAPVPQSRERLATLLWGSHFDAQARQNLRQAVFRLRRALGQDALIGDGEEISLAPGVIACDVVRLHDLVRDGNRTSLVEIAGLYKGRLLSDVTITEDAWREWLDVERQRVETLTLDALVALGEQELQAGQREQAMVAANRAVAINSLREDAHRLILKALAAMGRKAEALKHYQDFVALLKRELNAAPDSATNLLVAELHAAPLPHKSRPVEQIAKPAPAESSIAVMPAEDVNSEGRTKVLIVSEGRTKVLIVDEHTPLSVDPQQAERVRRIGILLPAAADSTVFQDRVGAFLQALGQSGWTVGHNLRIDARWATSNPAAIRGHAAELVALAPDVILAHGSPATGPLLQATRTVPIVFTVVADPVGAGLVDSLARPGGNATGFMSYEYSLSGKWPKLLNEIAPGMTRVAALRDPTVTSGTGQFAAIQAVARALRMEVSAVNAGDAAELERAIATFARAPNGGLIVTASGAAVLHRDLIIALAARYALPAIYYERMFPVAGGLISYGPNYIDQYRQAAGYIDRILKGEQPSDLPVQAPARYELTINLKAAKALGLEPRWQTVLARADEVLE